MSSKRWSRPRAAVNPLQTRARAGNGAPASAIYDFSDWTPPTGLTQTDPDFVHFGMNNYAQTLIWTTLKNLSLNPVNLVPEAIAHGFQTDLYDQ
jgi:hypothetical protein